MRRLAGFLTVFSLMFIFSATDGFALVLKQNTEELTLKSSRILTGKVIDIKSRWNKQKTTIYTYVTVSVEQHIKGASDKKEVTIKVPGGTVGNITLRVSDVAQFAPQEKVLLFLEPEEKNYLRVRGWHQGKYSIKNNKILEKKIPVKSFIKQIEGIMKGESGSKLPPKSLLSPKTKTKVKKGSLLPMKKEPAHMQLDANLVKEILKKKAISSSDADSLIIRGFSGLQNIMTEDFEGAFPSAGWTVGDGGTYPGEYYWGKDDYRPYSGSYSAWCARNGANGLDPEFNNYPNYCESIAIYGPFDLSGATQADITLRLWLESEYGYDWVSFLVSTDGFNTYGGESYSGFSDGWIPMTFDLTDVPVLGNVTGQPQVWIAALFTSDDSYTYRGAFIDDIVLRKYIPQPPPGINSISPSLGSAGTGTTVTISGSNFGSSQGGSVVTFSTDTINPVSANIISWSDTSIQCTVPAEASSGNVKVITSAGTSNGVPFTVTFGYAGIKWYDVDIPVSYYINESGTPDCVNEFIAVQNSFQTWEDVEGSYMDFAYEGMASITGANHNDNYNVISWGDAEGSIAVTWIRYSGDRILETDMIFNSSLAWSDSGELGKFDVQNIATHEAGHFLVLGDLYGTADSEKTMYGFGTTGETKKRTLRSEDEQGIIYIYEGYPPILEWTGEVGYESDGLEPETGYATADFTFKIKYIDADGDQPLVRKVYIDKNGDGDYIDPGEANDMTASGSDYASGVIYTYTTTIPYSPGSQNCSYYFEFSDGIVFATGNIAQAINEETAINKPDVFQTLGISIDKNSWGITPVPIQIPAPGQVMSQGERIKVTNSGDGLQTFALRIQDEDDKDEWVHGPTEDSPTLNTYVLSAIFCGASDIPGSPDYNEGESDDVVNNSLQLANGTRFAYSSGSQNGQSVGPLNDVYLYFELDLPTSVNGTYFDEEHKMTVELSCQGE